MFGPEIILPSQLLPMLLTTSAPGTRPSRIMSTRSRGRMSRLRSLLRTRLTSGRSSPSSCTARGAAFSRQTSGSPQILSAGSPPLMSCCRPCPTLTGGDTKIITADDILFRISLQIQPVRRVDPSHEGGSADSQRCQVRLLN